MLAAFALILFANINSLIVILAAGVIGCLFQWIMRRRKGQTK